MSEPYECHITIDPVTDENERATLEVLVRSHNFQLAKLFMAKDQPSTRDTFMTGHDSNYERMKLRMGQLIQSARRLGFIIRRAKIEHIIFDTKYGDVMP